MGQCVLFVHPLRIWPGRNPHWNMGNVQAEGRALHQRKVARPKSNREQASLLCSLIRQASELPPIPLALAPQQRWALEFEGQTLKTYRRVSDDRCCRGPTAVGRWVMPWMRISVHPHHLSRPLQRVFRVYISCGLSRARGCGCCQACHMTVVAQVGAGSRCAPAAGRLQHPAAAALPAGQPQPARASRHGRLGLLRAALAHHGLRPARCAPILASSLHIIGACFAIRVMVFWKNAHEGFVVCRTRAFRRVQSKLASCRVYSNLAVHPCSQAAHGAQPTREA